MADVTLTYKGATIGELSETGNKTIKTAGKYCEADILLEYVKQGGVELPPNLLDGVEFFNGKLTSSDTVDTTATGNWVYSDYIDVSPSATYIAIEKKPQVNGETLTLSASVYNASKAQLHQRAFYSIGGNAYFDGVCGYFTTVSNAASIRITTPTYSGADLYLQKIDVFMAALTEQFKHLQALGA